MIATYSRAANHALCVWVLFTGRVIYANTRFDAAAIQFDDEFIYQQMNASIVQRKIPFIHYPHPLALKVFEDWKKMENKKLY